MPPFHDTWRDLMKAIRSFASGSTFAGPCASIYLLAAASCGLREQTHTHTQSVKYAQQDKHATHHATHTPGHASASACACSVRSRPPSWRPPPPPGGRGCCSPTFPPRPRDFGCSCRRRSAPRWAVPCTGKPMLGQTHNTPHNLKRARKDNGCVSVEPLNTKASTRTGETPARN